MVITNFRISRLTFVAFRVSVSKFVGFFVPLALPFSIVGMYLAQPRSSFRLPRNEDIREVSVFRPVPFGRSGSPGLSSVICQVGPLVGPERDRGPFVPLLVMMWMYIAS
jgi:hypothetical protein